MNLTPGDHAYQLVNGYRAAQIVASAARLKIPDLLAAGPMSVDRLSEVTEIDVSRLRRLLRGLTTLGVVTVEEDGRFANTEVGELFREGVPGSRRPMAMMLIPESYRDWDHFMETLRTGVTGHSLAHGGSLWETIARDPDFAVRFNLAMASNSEEAVQFVAGSGNFAKAALIVDVGGGTGALAGGILRAYPNLRGIVCDVAAGLTKTREYLASLGVADRCSVVETDFFKSVPSGGNVYLLKQIIHDWDDEHAAAILSVCRRAMVPGARLIIIERILPSRVTNDPSHLNPVMTDLQMMVQLGAMERTLEQYQRLLTGAGFRFTRLVPGSLYGLVDAVAT
jgi:orsellinic acid C2-O-methyltransferase